MKLIRPFLAAVLMAHAAAAPAQDDTAHRLSAAALGLTQQQVVYDPTYFVIAYPGGDVPADRGVCTDVVIRAYRKLGIDLQRAVHEDIRAHFALYPKKWGLRAPDRNIDHRRVPNLMTYFSRKGRVKPITADARDYLPGDIVTWDLGRGLTHIGIVVDRRSPDGQRPLIVHNVGQGQRLEDFLFRYPITGHYAYPASTP